MASFLEREGYFDGAGDREKLLLMKKKKRDFDFLTSGVLMEHQKHLLASLHFKARYDRLLFLPSIVMTLASGILAVLAQSALFADIDLPDKDSEAISELATAEGMTVNETYAELYVEALGKNDQNGKIREICAIVIAVLAAVSVFWQTLIKQLDYGGRASLHDSAAAALAKIYKMSKMISREQEIIEMMARFSEAKNEQLMSERHTPRQNQMEGLYASSVATKSVQNRGGPTDLEQIDEEAPDGASNNENSGTAEDGLVNAPPPRMNAMRATEAEHFALSKQFEQALQGCTSVVPLKITAAFDSLHARINACNKKLVSHKKSSNSNAHVAWEKVYPALYHQLTITIISTRLWPYFVPGSEWAVDKTIQDFKTNSMQESGILEAIVERAHEIDEKYSRMEPMEDALGRSTFASAA